MLDYYSGSGRCMDDTDKVAADEPKQVFRKSMYQGNNVRFMPTSYYSYEAVLLLFCLTVSLLILPLILPPLPPPPFLLLLLPIVILGVLVLLALTPSNAKEVTYASL